MASQLPPQEWKGLRAEGTLRALPQPGPYTHTLDLRLTNASSESEQNVSIEGVTLGAATADFERPPTTTLWQRGSSADYPSAARWDVPQPAPSGLPLHVIVRYEH